MRQYKWFGQYNRYTGTPTVQLIPLTSIDITNDGIIYTYIIKESEKQ